MRNCYSDNNSFFATVVKMAHSSAWSIEKSNIVKTEKKRNHYNLHFSFPWGFSLCVTQNLRNQSRTKSPVLLGNPRWQERGGLWSTRDGLWVSQYLSKNLWSLVHKYLLLWLWPYWARALMIQVRMISVSPRGKPFTKHCHIYIRRCL